jgi:hypothetical protein
MNSARLPPVSARGVLITLIRQAEIGYSLYAPKWPIKTPD